MLSLCLGGSGGRSSRRRTVDDSAFDDGEELGLPGRLLRPSVDPSPEFKEKYRYYYLINF